jgi:hypothetical protein
MLKIGWNRSMDRWITSRKWSNAFDHLGIAIYIGWPIYSMSLSSFSRIKRRTRRPATGSGSRAFELPFLIQLGIDQQVDQLKQLYTSNYIYPTIFLMNHITDTSEFTSRSDQSKQLHTTQLHIAQYFFNEPHHEYKLFILQYSIHPPATLLYFLRTLESQLCSPCLVNQKSGI